MPLGVIADELENTAADKIFDFFLVRYFEKHTGFVNYTVII